MKKRGCGATAGRHSLLGLYWLLEIILPQTALIYTDFYHKNSKISHEGLLSTNHYSIITIHY